MDILTFEWKKSLKKNENKLVKLTIYKYNLYYEWLTNNTRNSRSYFCEKPDEIPNIPDSILSGTEINNNIPEAYLWLYSYFEKRRKT